MPTRTGRVQLPFPQLGATIALAVHLLFEEHRNSVQPRPSRGRTLVVNGAPKTYGASFPYRVRALANPRSQIPFFTHRHTLALPAQAPVRPHDRPVGGCLCGLHTKQLPTDLVRSFRLRSAVRIRQHSLRRHLARQFVLSQRNLIIRRGSCHTSANFSGRSPTRPKRVSSSCQRIESAP
jgi:hypothetical protein